MLKLDTLRNDLKGFKSPKDLDTMRLISMSNNIIDFAENNPKIDNAGNELLKDFLDTAILVFAKIESGESYGDYFKLIYKALNYGNEFFLYQKYLKEIEKSSVNDNGYKVGDVLYYQFGYDCTINKFYKVVKTTKKKLSLVELDSEHSYESLNSGSVVAVDKVASYEIKNTNSNNPKIDGYPLRAYKGESVYFSND